MTSNYCCIVVLIYSLCNARVSSGLVLVLFTLGYLQPLLLNFSPISLFPPISPPPIFSSPAAVPPKYSPIPHYNYKYHFLYQLSIFYLLTITRGLTAQCLG
jgi:hypothetical protein